MTMSFVGLTAAIKSHIRTARVDNPSYRLSHTEFLALQAAFEAGQHEGNLEILQDIACCIRPTEDGKVNLALLDPDKLSLWMPDPEYEQRKSDEWDKPGLQISTGSINGLGWVRPKEYYPLRFDDDGLQIEEPWCTPNQVRDSE